MQSGVSYFVNEMTEKFIRYVLTFPLVLYFDKEITWPLYYEMDVENERSNIM
jgi:hypothetical protein